MAIQQEFNREQHGTAYKVVITLGEVCGKIAVQVWLYWHTGYGGGGRQAATKFAGGDFLARLYAGLSGPEETRMPRAVLADAMQEEGYDEGITSTVRGSDF